MWPYNAVDQRKCAGGRGLRAWGEGGMSSWIRSQRGGNAAKCPLGHLTCFHGP